MAIGVSTVNTYTPVNILGPGADKAIRQSCTVYHGLGQLVAGTVMGLMAATGCVSDYDLAGAATTTAVSAGAANQGANTVANPTVYDANTLTEDWTLTCTDDSVGGSEKWSVVGSVSGNVGEATTAVEFTDADSKISFTIADPGANAVEGDVFTFSTTAAKATTACGILSEDVDATTDDVASMIYVTGNFIESRLTGLDADAKVHMLARSAGGLLLI